MLAPLLAFFFFFGLLLDVRTRHTIHPDAHSLSLHAEHQPVVICLSSVVTHTGRSSNALALAQVARKTARAHTKSTVMGAERGCDTPLFGSRERISERIDEQVVDHSRLEAERADVAEAGKNSGTKLASDH